MELFFDDINIEFVFFDNSSTIQDNIYLIQNM